MGYDSSTSIIHHINDKAIFEIKFCTRQSSVGVSHKVVIASMILYQVHCL